MTSTAFPDRSIAFAVIGSAFVAVRDCASQDSPSNSAHLVAVSIFVSGLWHLGCVTAACLAEHYEVVAHDPDAGVIEALVRGEPPVSEPGLADLLKAGQRSGMLSFTSELDGVASADSVWITYDTPVNDQDEGDVDFVARRIEALLPHARPGTLIVISSQVPAGFVARLERSAAAAGADVAFAYVPENLRLGEALSVFRNPDRIVCGIRTERDRERMRALLSPLTGNILWMSPESAEMAKHALNAFLATSVTFINEVAELCEYLGADVKDVERALKSESRIGPRAYLSAGGGIGGGTLARDLRTLSAIGRQTGAPTQVVDGVLARNDVQRRWTERTLRRELSGITNPRIAVLGLTYKPGTDTLRRSTAVELCRSLAETGAWVAAYDPVVRDLPAELSAVIHLSGSAAEALDGADAVVIGTEWPAFRQLTASSIEPMRHRIVVDPKRWLEDPLAAAPGVRYLGVGRPAAETK